jgi:nucleotide-binding universal stress UspA family protein
MFRKILLPVDLTDRHAPALTIAADLAGRADGQVTLLHVIEVIAGSSVEEERNFYGRLEKAARAHLGRLGEVLKARAIPWRAEVLLGNRVPEVIHYAAASGADLIVLTAPRLEANHPGTGWGSLSFKIGFVCPCPVLLVK